MPADRAHHVPAPALIMGVSWLIPRSIRRLEYLSAIRTVHEVQASHSRNTNAGWLGWEEAVRSPALAAAAAPHVHPHRYDHTPAPGTPEADLIDACKNPRTWV